MLFQPWSQPSSSPSPPSLCPPINFKVKKKCDLVVQQELHVLKDVISMGTCDKQMLMKMTEDVPTFSCLFLFFQARKVSKVIRVTSAPRAARCRDRDDQDEQSTDSVQGYISHMEYLRSSSHQASLALCGGNIWGSDLAASHVYQITNHPSSPHFLSVPPARFHPPSPPSSCLFSVQSPAAGRVGTYRRRRPPDTPRTNRTYYSLWRPGSTCTPAEDTTQQGRQCEWERRGNRENRQHLVLGMYLAGWILSLSECHVGPNVWGWTHIHYSPNLIHGSPCRLNSPWIWFPPSLFIIFWLLHSSLISFTCVGNDLFALPEDSLVRTGKQLICVPQFFLENKCSLSTISRWPVLIIHPPSRLTICVLAFFFSASPCFLLTTSSSFFSSQLSMVSKQNITCSVTQTLLKQIKPNDRHKN